MMSRATSVICNRLFRRVFSCLMRAISACSAVEVASNIDPQRHPADIIAMTNIQTTLSALTWDPMTRTISEESTLLVDEGNAGWALWLLQIVAVLQNTAAQACGAPVSPQHNWANGLPRTRRSLVAQSKRCSPRWPRPSTPGISRRGVQMGHRQ